MPSKIIHPSSKVLFLRFVPNEAVDFCVQLHQVYKFELRVKPPRKSKLGDYRYDRETGKHTITVNGDLKKYSFLITYIHEVAHLITVQKYGLNVAHHGKEWKHEYANLLLESLKTRAFPPLLEREILIFSRNPKASTAASAKLIIALNQFENEGLTLLSGIGINQKFEFRGESYIKLEKKRTRSLCLRVADNKKYLISEIAEVDIV